MLLDVLGMVWLIVWFLVCVICYGLRGLYWGLCWFVFWWWVIWCGFGVCFVVICYLRADCVFVWLGFISCGFKFWISGFEVFGGWVLVVSWWLDVRVI